MADSESKSRSKPGEGGLPAEASSSTPVEAHEVGGRSDGDDSAEDLGINVDDFFSGSEGKYGVLDAENPQEIKKLDNAQFDQFRVAMSEVVKSFSPLVKEFEETVLSLGSSANLEELSSAREKCVELIAFCDEWMSLVEHQSQSPQLKRYKDIAQRLASTHERAKRIYPIILSVEQIQAKVLESIKSFRLDVRSTSDSIGRRIDELIDPDPITKEKVLQIVEARVNEEDVDGSVAMVVDAIKRYQATIERRAKEASSKKKSERRPLFQRMEKSDAERIRQPHTKKWFLRIINKAFVQGGSIVLSDVLNKVGSVKLIGKNLAEAKPLEERFPIIAERVAERASFNLLLKRYETDYTYAPISFSNDEKFARVFHKYLSDVDRVDSLEKISMAAIMKLAVELNALPSSFSEKIKELSKEAGDPAAVDQRVAYLQVLINNSSGANPNLRSEVVGFLKNSGLERVLEKIKDTTSKSTDDKATSTSTVAAATATPTADATPSAETGSSAPTAV
ncbi:MAG: hypothetical protein WDA09_10785, partial [Bacteriovoracaceae bacterium]